MSCSATKSVTYWRKFDGQIGRYRPSWLSCDSRYRPFYNVQQLRQLRVAENLTEKLVVTVTMEESISNSPNALSSFLNVLVKVSPSTLLNDEGLFRLISFLQKHQQNKLEKKKNPNLKSTTDQHVLIVCLRKWGFGLVGWSTKIFCHNLLFSSRNQSKIHSISSTIQMPISWPPHHNHQHMGANGWPKWSLLPIQNPPKTQWFDDHNDDDEDDEEIPLETPLEGDNSCINGSNRHFSPPISIQRSSIVDQRTPPPQFRNRVVVYFMSLQGIRRTYEDAARVGNFPVDARGHGWERRVNEVGM